MTNNKQTQIPKNQILNEEILNLTNQISGFQFQSEPQTIKPGLRFRLLIFEVYLEFAA